MRREAVSVVVPTRDRAAMLEGSLASLRAALGPDDELVVVDSASIDPAVRTVAESHRATYLRCDRPGAARARNRGGRAARHDLIAFVDDDARVAPDWADAIASTFRDHPEVAFLTGRIDVPDDETADRPVAVTTDAQPYVLDAAFAGNMGQSANMAIRREALVAVGGFDEQLGPGGPRRAIAEDVDLFDRLVCAGLLGRYEPSVRGWHRQWRGRWDLVKLDWRYGRGNGFRVAKLARLHRPRARIVARVVMWNWGLRGIVAALRQGFEFGAAVRVVRVAGVIAGFSQAVFLPVTDGHFGRR